MDTQASNMLSTFFGEKLGKSISAFVVCLSLGAWGMYSLPQYLVTVEIFNAKISSILYRMDRADAWQAVNTLKLSESIYSSELRQLEDEIDAAGTMTSERMRGRLERLKSSVVKIQTEIRVFKDFLQAVEAE